MCHLVSGTILKYVLFTICGSIQQLQIFKVVLINKESGPFMLISYYMYIVPELQHF